MRNAVRNLVEQTYNCGASTGFEWLLESYQLEEAIIPNGLKDSITDLIGNYINTAVNGTFLDVYSMGEYFDLLDFIDGIETPDTVNDFEIQVYPNPFHDEINIQRKVGFPVQTEVSVYDLTGRPVNKKQKSVLLTGVHQFSLKPGIKKQGVYLVLVKIGEQAIVRKIIKE